jgi:hypothetical protein
LSDVPKQLGKYQIRRAIGKGAMGIVYEGFDPVIDRVVAIKTIKKDELDQEEAEEHSRRFLIEAKAAGRLNHKNIVGIYDYGEEKGLSFIVMEFVQGKELKSFFAARHPFSMSQIVRLMGELLDALGYSHSRGVVHRDVKPDNIFVTHDGSVKLGDFGIARIDSTSKTHAGTVLGTPSYMAPEQIRGETADARSDLYAAGVILYQFLVGERPFSGGMVAVMQKVLMEAPKPPSSHNPSIPEAIDSVVLKALAKAGNDRFASAAEFSRELSAAVGLADTEDESESTMIMSAATLKALQDGIVPGDRTNSGTGGTHTGTGGTSATGPAGRTGASGRGPAIEEARRRAEEAKRRYEEDLKRAEIELEAAEDEQRAAEAEAQAQADAWLGSTQALLAESAARLESGRLLFVDNTLLVDGPDVATGARAVGTKMRESAEAIGAFVAASYALLPAVQTQLEARQGELAAAATAQDALAERVEHEGRSALGSFEQKLEVLEKRLAGQDGAWGNESRALEALDGSAGDAPIAVIQERLDKLAASIDQVGKGFASVQAQALKLPTPQAERLAVVEAQLHAQSGFIARLHTEVAAARERVRAVAEKRRLAEEEARKAAEAEAARKKAEEAARLKAEADAAAEQKRLADEKARREEEAARNAAEAAAVEKKRREAEAAAKAKADAEAAAEKKRVADEKMRADAAAAAERRAADVAEKEAQRIAAAEKKRLAEEEAARAAQAEARRKADQAAAAARQKADDEARRKADAEAKAEARRKADEEARRKSDADAKRQAEGETQAKAEAAAREKAAFEARRKADEEASRQAELEAGRARDAAALGALAAADADATMVAKAPVRPNDDAEATMIRVIPGKTTPPAPPPAPTPEPRKTPAASTPPAPSASASATRKKLPLVPIAGAAIVVLAVGAWLVLRPAATPTGEPVAPPQVIASAPEVPVPAPPASSTPAVAPTPASQPGASAVAPADAGARQPAPPTDAPQPAVDAGARPATKVGPDTKPRDSEKPAPEKPNPEKPTPEKPAPEKPNPDKPAPEKTTPEKIAPEKPKDTETKPRDPGSKPDNPGTKVDTDPPLVKIKPADAKAEAADTFRKGYEAYLAGRVPEGIRMMERADSMGAPGARARLCAIYRKPTAAEGKDFLKDANKCKGVD